NWNLIENNLMSLYALVMGDYLPKTQRFTPPTHPVAYQIFDSLNAFAPRVELLEKLLVWRVPDQKVKHFRETLKPKLRKRFSERSVIAHGVWGVCDKYPDALILVPTYGHQMIYKKRDFQDISKRIVEDHKILGTFIQEIYQSRNAGI